MATCAQATATAQLAAPPWLQEDVLLPPCGQEDPSRLSAGSLPLLGSEKDLPRLPGSVASAGRSSTLIKGSSGKYLGGTRYKVGEGNGTPLQDSCLENPMDGGAW